jgi:hypothetical protein
MNDPREFSDEDLAGRPDDASPDLSAEAGARPGPQSAAETDTQDSASPEFPTDEHAERYDSHLYVPLAPLHTIERRLETAPSALKKPTPGDQAPTRNDSSYSISGAAVLLLSLGSLATVGWCLFHRETGMSDLVPVLVGALFCASAALLLAFFEKVLRTLAVVAFLGGVLVLIALLVHAPRTQPLPPVVAALPKPSTPAATTAAIPTQRTRLPTSSSLPPGPAPVLRTPAAMLPSPTVIPLLRQTGAFGFPQSTARVIADTSQLRVSAASDAANLYVQVLFWADTTPDEHPDEGETTKDYSELLIDCDASGGDTPYVDRQYGLNHFPYDPGLHYAESRGPMSVTPLKSDSKGRGSIRWVADAGRQVRVDNYIVPLAELGRHVGERLRLGVYMRSLVPDTVVTVPPAQASAGRARAYSYDVPRAQFMEYVLDGKSRFDVAAVPNDTDTEVHKIVMRNMAAPQQTTRSVGSFRPSLEGPHPTPPPEVPNQPEPQILAATSDEIRRNGAFGFPQAQATVLREMDGVRVSVASDSKYLFLQAVHFEGSSASLAMRTSPIARASLHMWRPTTANNNIGPDAQYWLNQYYDARGLVLTLPRPIGQGGGGRRRDLHGRGSIRWARSGAGPLIRIDSFLMPLQELDCAPGQALAMVDYRFSYLLASETEDPRQTFWYNHVRQHLARIPLRPMPRYVVAGDAAIDPSQVPDDYPDQTSATVVEVDPYVRFPQLAHEAARKAIASPSR